MSDQYGSLYRVTPPGIGQPATDTHVSRLDIELGRAHGLLWAFESLYVMVNGGNQYKSGLYRVKDTNGDDAFDDVRLLREISGGGEYGPHAILAHPDGNNLVVVCGNSTKLTAMDSSRVPLVWDEDLLHEHLRTRFYAWCSRARRLDRQGGRRK